MDMLEGTKNNYYDIRANKTNNKERKSLNG